MVNIVVGLVAICLAIWGLVTYWWYTVDVIIAIFPLALLFFGIIAVMAGIKNTGLKATVVHSSKQPSDAPAAKKKDEEVRACYGAGINDMGPRTILMQGYDKPGPTEPTTKEINE